MLAAENEFLFGVFFGFLGFFLLFVFGFFFKRLLLFFPLLLTLQVQTHAHL